jgi:hypothetical protein
MQDFTSTQVEIVQKFLSILTGLTRECGVEIVDTGGFVFRMHDGKPYLTVSRDFIQYLGNHAIVLSLNTSATSDIIADLEPQIDVVEIYQSGDNYHAKCSSMQLYNTLPLYIRQLIDRKSLSTTEYTTLCTYLNSHSISSTTETPKISSTSETPKISSTSETPKITTRQQPIESIQNSDSDAEDSEISNKQVHVNIPSEDDSESDVVTSPVTQVKSPIVEKSPQVEKSPVKTQKLNVVFFKKLSDGTKDKSICRSGKYVYKIIKGEKMQLVGIGVYDSKTNGYTPLSKNDKAEIIKLGFTV